MVHPQLKHRLSSMDSLFLYFERKEAPMNIGSAIIMDGVISFTEFKEMIAAKLPLLPRYRQKLVPSPFNSGHPTWESDPNFDISRHILDITLDAPGTMEELRILAGKIHSTMLDRSKPLWEIYVVNGLEGERSALITKVHHAMADGVSGVDLMEIVLDSSPTPTPVPIPEDTPPAPAKSPTFAEGLMGNWLDSTEEALKNWSMFQRSLLDLAQNLIKEPDRIFRPLAFNLLPTLTSPAPTLVFNRANTGQLELSWTEFPFADFHAIKVALGGTINDVGLTVLGSAVAKYLKTRHDSLAGRSLRLMVPVNMRPPDQTGALGNMISMLPVEIPLDLEDPLKLYAFVTNETGKLKEGHIAEELSLIVNLWGILPSSAQAMLGSIANTPVPLVNMVCTNVPGPKVPLYVLGKRVTHCYPYVPTAYLTSLSCAIFSYDKKLFFGLTADAQAVPDLNEYFKPILEQAFKELRKAAEVSKAKVSLAV